MKNQLSFDADEWEEFLKNIDFTDNEKRIIEFARRGWAQEDIAAELYTSRASITRRTRAITNKIMRYIIKNYKKVL